MTLSDMVRKLKRGMVSFDEILKIADVSGVRYEPVFVFPDRGKNRIEQNEICSFIAIKIVE